MMNNPRDEAERAAILPEVMARVAGSYPFPSIEGDGLDLNSEQKVRAWLADFEPTTSTLEYAATDQDSRLRDLLRHLSADEASRLENDLGTEEGALLSPERSHYDQLYLDFRAFVTSATAVAALTKREAERVDRYRDRLPSQGTLIVAGIVAFAVFVCGVALPMICPSVSSVVAAWIPAVAYDCSCWPLSSLSPELADWRRPRDGLLERSSIARTAAASNW